VRTEGEGILNCPTCNAATYRSIGGKDICPACGWGASPKPAESLPSPYTSSTRIPSLSSLLFANEDILMLIQPKTWSPWRLSAWSMRRRARLLDIPGTFIGLTRDRQALLVRHEQYVEGHQLAALAAYELATGKQLDRRDIDAGQFAPDQRLFILIGRGELIAQDVFEPQVTNSIPLAKGDNLSFDDELLVRTYPTPHVVIRTHVEGGGFEADGLACYNVLTGRRIFEAPSQPFCGTHVACGSQQNTFAIEECGYILIYDLGSGVKRYDIKRPSPANLSTIAGNEALSEPRIYLDEYHNVVSDPRSITALGLHPQDPHMIAAGAGNEIQLIDMNYEGHELFKAWSSGRVIARLRVPGAVTHLTFTPGGERLIGITENRKVNIWSMATGELIDQWPS
jgi:hypothetical protein